jgi:hypothetical protein
MKRFKLALRSDTGLRYVSTVATDEQTARQMVCAAECAPPCAVKWCKEDTRKYWIEKEITIFRKGDGYTEPVCSYERTIAGLRECKADLAEYRASGDSSGSYFRRYTQARHSLALPA